ncbi:MAG: acyl-CoA thioesterase [Acidobacteriia bacterium]|nr:acyl-CoA thioesterase [Terriglobia bacterium]
MPSCSGFYAPLQVRFAETDMQGQVFFGNYLTYFDVAITEYVKALGFGVAEFLREGLDFYYVESLCQYKSRALFDEKLHVHVSISHLGNTSFKFSFEIHEETTARLVCTGHVVSVVVNKSTHQPAPIPQAFRDAVARFQSPQ